MTEARRKGLRAAVVIVLAPLMSSCVYLTAAEQSQFAVESRANVIPDDVRAALDCDISIPGSGLGVDGGQSKMLGGYRPASLNDGPAIHVFWCARAENKFVLAFVRDGRLMHPECPPALTWPYVPKAALSISDEPRPLDEFAEADRVNHTGHARRKHAKLTGKTAGSIVIDGDDSLSNEFYCHKGVWLVRVQD